MTVKYEVVEGEKWQRSLKVEVPLEEVKDKFAELYRSIKAEAKIPGFRPGKAPMATIKARFAEVASKEVFEGLIQDSFREALEQSGLDPLGQPQFKDVDFGEDKPLVYTAEFEVKPEIEIETSTGFHLKRPDDTVTEGEVKHMLEYIQRKNSELASVDRPAREGDFVTADLEVLSESTGKLEEKKFENVQIELQPSGLGRQFLEPLGGKNVGDEIEFEVNYPTEHFDERFAGSTVRYLAKINAVKELHLVELDEDFLSRMGEGIKTEEDFRDKIKADIQTTKTKQADDALREEAIKAVIDANRFDLPESMLGSFLDNVVADYRRNSQEDIEEEEIRKNYRALGIRQIRWSLLMHRIAEKENIKVEQADIDARLQRFADNYNMTLEEARKQVVDSNQIADLKETILESKVIEYVIDNSTTETVDAPMMQPAAE